MAAEVAVVVFHQTFLRITVLVVTHTCLIRCKWCEMAGCSPPCIYIFG